MMTKVKHSRWQVDLDFTCIEDAAGGTAMLYQAKVLKHNIYNIATGIQMYAEWMKKVLKFN